jgi:tRNA dimethylallyltransferase
MQVYKYMNIGTAKPDEEEMEGIPHHMIDIAEPQEAYNLALYAEDAKKVIADIHSRGKIPVLAGGTGLYIDTVINGTELIEQEVDEEYRQHLYKIADEQGADTLFEMLCDIDPDSAEVIHKNNIKRVVRALEFFHSSGVRQSEHNSAAAGNAPYNTVKFNITMPRELLYDRINLRVDKMIAAGLAEEVEFLINYGVPADSTSMQGIGYKEMLLYLKGELSLSDTADMIKQATRRYAKRQITWFKREQNTYLVDGEKRNYCEIFQKTMELCKIL